MLSKNLKTRFREWSSMQFWHKISESVFVWQICDFGLAKWKDYSQTNTSSRSKRGGTVSHTPPESWNDINCPRTVKYDVYGFAVLLWELFSEDTPFKHGIADSMFSSVRRHLYRPDACWLSIQLDLSSTKLRTAAQLNSRSACVRIRTSRGSRRG